MRIKMLTAVTGAERSLQHGDFVDVTDTIGAAWIAEGMAVADAGDAVPAITFHDEPARPSAKGPEPAAAAADHTPAAPAEAD